MGFSGRCQSGDIWKSHVYACGSVGTGSRGSFTVCGVLEKRKLLGPLALKDGMLCNFFVDRKTALMIGACETGSIVLGLSGELTIDASTVHAAQDPL